jgi:predicted dehydrogenase
MLVVLLSCAGEQKTKTRAPAGRSKWRLLVLNPGHYHAALVQKTMYDEVDPAVRVYAPDGPEVQEYLGRIEGFNNRPDSPTDWTEEVYVGEDYLRKMLAEKRGDVVVLSGNNRDKTDYIMAAVEAGLNVYADKPMCIDPAGFRMLEQAFAAADEKGRILYDIMTERYNVLRMLQKRLVLDRDVFGYLQTGSPEDPAVISESVHHFFKYVSGKPIRRPRWYFDTAQQGGGLVDVTTHLIDLVMWTCFPTTPLDYRRDVAVLSARHWPTMITGPQYEKVTGAAEFPSFLQGRLNEQGVLPYFCNGEMTYTIKDVHVRVAVSWNFEAPAGAGDTHYSLFRGSRAHVIIRQGEAENYRPQLYVEPAPGANPDQLRGSLRKALLSVQVDYPGLSLEPSRYGWRVSVPQELFTGHEAHFRSVTEQYLDYLAEGKLPPWEIDFMRAKYFITTRALELAGQE